MTGPGDGRRSNGRTPKKKDHSAGKDDYMCHHCLRLVIKKSEKDPHMSDEESRAVSFLVTQERVKSMHGTDSS